MHFRILIIFLALSAVAAKPVKKTEVRKPETKKPVAERAPAPIPVALPNYDEETSVKLQIFLDNNDFGPGKIDGRMGEFFRKALVHYKRAHGMAETGAVDSWLFDQVPETYTTFTIPPEALNFVGPTASKPSEQSKLKGLKYGSLLELIAERYHSAEDFVKKLNPGLKMENLKPGDTVKVPNVLPFKIEDLHEGFAQPNPAFANRKLYVDTKERFLLIYDNKQLVAEFPITPGSTTLPAPLGLWKILGIATMPVFRHDEGVLQHGVKSGQF